MHKETCVFFMLYVGDSNIHTATSSMSNTQKPFRTICEYKNPSNSRDTQINVETIGYGDNLSNHTNNITLFTAYHHSHKL